MLELSRQEQCRVVCIQPLETLSLRACGPQHVGRSNAARIATLTDFAAGVAGFTVLHVQLSSKRGVYARQSLPLALHVYRQSLPIPPGFRR